MPKAEKKVIQVFVCEVCKKEHSTNEEAIKCEDSHKCICKRRNDEGFQLVRLSYTIMQGANHKMYIDYRTGEIIELIFGSDLSQSEYNKLLSSRSFTSRIEKKVILKLKHCPSCGKVFK